MSFASLATWKWGLVPRIKVALKVSFLLVHTEAVSLELPLGRARNSLESYREVIKKP